MGRFTDVFRLLRYKDFRLDSECLGREKIHRVYYSNSKKIIKENSSYLDWFIRSAVDNSRDCLVAYDKAVGERSVEFADRNYPILFAMIGDDNGVNDILDEALLSYQQELKQHKDDDVRNRENRDRLSAIDYFISYVLRCYNLDHQESV